MFGFPFINDTYINLTGIYPRQEYDFADRNISEYMISMVTNFTARGWVLFECVCVCVCVCACVHVHTRACVCMLPILSLLSIPCTHVHVYVCYLSYLSYLSRSLADRWGTTVDLKTSFLHSSRFSALRSSIFHSRPVHSLMLSSHRFLCLCVTERLPKGGGEM